MGLPLTAKPGNRLVSIQPAESRLILCLLASVLLAIAMLSGNRAHAASIDLVTRVNLQLALKQYIDAGTVDGVYDHFNAEKGQIEKLKLKTLHPVIFVMEGKYMMCADFVNDAGDAVMLDYIVGTSSKGFRIEQQIPGRRSYLQLFFERSE